MSQNKQLLLCAMGLSVGYGIAGWLDGDWSDAFDAIYYSCGALLIYGLFWRRPV